MLKGAPFIFCAWISDDLEGETDTCQLHRRSTQDMGHWFALMDAWVIPRFPGFFGSPVQQLSTEGLN